MCNRKFPSLRKQEVEIRKAANEFRSMKGPVDVVTLVQGGYANFLESVADGDSGSITRRSEELIACAAVAMFTAAGGKDITPERLEAVQLLRDCASAEDVLAVQKLAADGQKAGDQTKQLEADVQRLQQELDQERATKAKATEDVGKLNSRVAELQSSHQAVEEQLELAHKTIAGLRQEVGTLQQEKVALSDSKAQTPAQITVGELRAECGALLHKWAEMHQDYIRGRCKTSEQIVSVLRQIQEDADIQSVIKAKPLMKAAFDLVCNEVANTLP